MCYEYELWIRTLVEYFLLLDIYIYIYIYMRVHTYTHTPTATRTRMHVYICICIQDDLSTALLKGIQDFMNRE
jgi:hypothetical protein